MKRLWKWVLGVALVLLLCAAAGGTFFALRHGFVARQVPLVRGDQPGEYGWDMPRHHQFYGPDMRQRDFGPGAYPHMGMPHRYGPKRFGGPFMFVGGLVRLLVPLVIFGFVAFGAYQLGKQAGMRTAPPSVAAAPPAAPEVPEKEGDESPQ